MPPGSKIFPPQFLARGPDRGGSVPQSPELILALGSPQIGAHACPCPMLLCVSHPPRLLADLVPFFVAALFV